MSYKTARPTRERLLEKLTQCMQNKKQLKLITKPEVVTIDKNNSHIAFGKASSNEHQADTTSQ